jgi:predicted amidohydrolase
MSTAPSVHLVQFDIVWEDKEANYGRVETLLDGAGVRPGDLVVLPELFDTGFSFRLERTVDDGATRVFLKDLAARLGATVHGSLTALGDDERGRNRIVAVGPDGETLAEYDKIHPFSYGRETERFTGGDRTASYDWRWGEGAEEALRVGCAVCYDLRFPELFRAEMLAGAQAFALGANWPSPRAAHWRALAIARAIENQAFLFAVNRCGADPQLQYAGGSICVDPKGAVFAEAGDEERVVSAPIDAAALRAWRREFPAWRDARLPVGNRTAASESTGSDRAG